MDAPPELSADWALLDLVPDGVFVIDRQWRIAAFNRAAERLTGLSRAEVVGRTCQEVFRSSICKDGCAIRRAIESGEAVMVRSLTITRADGTRLSVCVSAAALHDAHGAVIGAIETFRDVSRIESAPCAPTQRTLPGVVGQSEAMQRLSEVVRRVARTDSTVLVHGESGTGKELIVRALHALSRRADAPLVVVNCGAVPDTLLESELFGYLAGSFTDARRDKPGRFELANGGTIFLDEIGDVSPALQLRLLRVLQEREIEPLGSTRPVPVDVRVVAATNRDLWARAEQGEFRRDLLYRIDVVRIDVPPLRERREDVPLLVDAFLDKLNMQRSQPLAGVSPEAMQMLLAHPYPGNVRELHNVLEHAAVFCIDGEIRPEHLPGSVEPGGPPDSAPSDPVESFQRSLLLSALARHNGNRRAAAADLGIHPTTLWRRANRLGIALPETDGRSSPA